MQGNAKRDSSVVTHRNVDTGNFYLLHHQMGKMTNIEHRGGCACGAIRFTALDNPIVVAQCHCEQCQRTSGTGHSTGVMFRSDVVTIEGDFSTYIYQAANGNEVTKAFCPVCSSPIYGCNTGNAAFMTLPIGCMDDVAAFQPEVVIFSDNRPDWDLIDPDLQSFATQPEWTPEKSR